MATEALGFEEKIHGLIAYHGTLEELNPYNNPNHNELANPELFYGTAISVHDGIRAAQKSVLFDIACHAHVEYGKRGLGKRDLREDTADQLAERADVLAVMTAPLTTADREARGERIAGILSSIVSGQTVRFTEYDHFHRGFKSPQEVAIDVSRALFGVFANGHVSDRILTVQYDTPTTFAPTGDITVGERVVNIDVPALVKGNSLRVEPVAA